MKIFLSALFASLTLVFSSFRGGEVIPSPTVFSSPLISLSTHFEYTVITETPIPTPTKRPTPTFTPTPTPRPTLSASSLDDLFTTYASRYNVDRELLKRIAFCESKFNPAATNEIYGGLFQFSESAWRVTRVRMGENQQPELRFNAEEAIKTAAFKISRDGVAAWPNCSK